MHIVFFSDHHPDSLGGVQTSLLLQKKYLEKLDHKVTVVAARRYRKGRTEGFIEVPSLPLPPTGAYSIQPSLHLAFRKVEKALAELAEPVDVVHIQADMWQAILGAKWAIDHKLPLVWTVHTNTQVAFDHNVGKIGRKTVGQVMNLWASSFLHQSVPKKSGSLWAFQEQISRNANFVAAPSNHFALELQSHDVASQTLVIPNGVDDEVVEGIELRAAADTAGLATRKIKLIWAGRLSSEKRISEFLGAFAQADLKDVELDVYGSGQLEAKARLLVHHLGISKVARIRGRMPHKQLVATFATADAVCQTSLGFETQGMTVYESISVGTPVFVVDPQIAGELPAANVWLAKKPDVDAMARGLRAMVADIRAGNTKRAIDTGEWTALQSKLTEKWLKTYAEAIAEGPKRFQI